MKPRNVLYLWINDIWEYNSPYPQSAFTHNQGKTFKIKTEALQRRPRRSHESFPFYSEENFLVKIHLASVEPT